MKQTQYSNLLFDLGNVILDIDVPGAIEKLTALMRPDAQRRIIDDVLIEYECGKVSTDIFINTLLSQSNRDVQALDIIEAWTSMLISIPSYRLDMLLGLRDSYNVYLLSNTNEIHLEWVRRYVQRTFGVSDFDATYFDNVYYSHLIGDRKPNASIFSFVREDALLTPEKTLFMDDIEENINSAKKMGFATYHVTPEHDIAEFLKIEGYY